jgi:hypothetical protein
VAAVYDGSALSVYINGVENTSVPWDRGIFPGTTQLTIGVALIAQSFFDGLIDEPTVYGRALSGDEIKSIYVEGSAGKCSVPVRVKTPQNQIGYWGGSVTFTVQASGASPLDYLWYKDGFAISWATNSSLLLTNLAFSDAGDYWVVVTNSLSSATSPHASLAVNPAGVSIGVYPGITIVGIVGKTYGIQYATNLDSPMWNILTNLTLAEPTQLWLDTDTDVTSGNRPRRYYRVIAVP